MEKKSEKEGEINKMKAFKGFNKDMTCRGFQYEEGKSYETKKADVCHEVEQDGEMSKSKDKTASTKIKIGVRLSIADMVKAAIDFTMASIKPEASADEDYGASSVTVNRGASSATGDYGVSSATGDRGASSATGDCGASSATGDCGASSAAGDYGVSSATGDYGVSSATGYKGASSATGYKGASSATGDYGASSATGDCGVASVTGCNSSAEVKNPTALAVAWGYKSRAKGVKGSYLVLADWEGDEGYPSDPEKWTLKGVKLVHIDGKKYKENTWYEYSDGVVREWTEE